jgi:hypothetical protein
MVTLMEGKRIHKEKPTGENCHNAIRFKSNNHYGYPLPGNSGNIISTVKQYKFKYISFKYPGGYCVLCRQRFLGLRSPINKKNVIKNFKRKSTVKDVFRKWDCILNSHRNLALK